MNTSLERLENIIRDLVVRYGHPDEIPVGALAKAGVDLKTAELAEYSIGGGDVWPPSDPAEAIDWWLDEIRRNLAE